MDNSPTPSDLIAQRVRALRKSRGMTVAELAARCADAGMPSLTMQTLYKLEGQRSTRQRPVSVDELLVLSYALDVSPLHLMVPPYPSPLWGGDGDSRSPEDPNIPNDDAPYPVTPGVRAPYWQVRQFIRGYRPLPGMDPWKYFAEVPAHERPPQDELARIAGDGTRPRERENGD